jgi:ABC-type antimicrobial peptide transport system permease subunit
MVATISQQRLFAMLTVGFGFLALVLACIGIYGLMAYNVARRTNEIGIRIAVGAQPSQVSLLVFRQGVRPVIGGLLVGVASSLAAGRLIRSFLFGTEARDPAAMLAVVALLLAVAAMACWAPARRASRIDPAIALRNE